MTANLQTGHVLDSSSITRKLADYSSIFDYRAVSWAGVYMIGDYKYQRIRARVNYYVRQAMVLLMNSKEHTCKLLCTASYGIINE